MRVGAPLGADLHERRQSLGLTAENVARCLDITPEIVARIEAGKDADASQVWRLHALLALAHDQRQAEPHPLPLSLAMSSLLRFERVRQQLTLKVVGQRIVGTRISSGSTRWRETVSPCHRVNLSERPNTPSERLRQGRSIRSSPQTTPEPERPHDRTRRRSHRSGDSSVEQLVAASVRYRVERRHACQDDDVTAA
jgi:hypothetical protein